MFKTQVGGNYSVNYYIMDFLSKRLSPQGDPPVVHGLNADAVILFISCFIVGSVQGHRICPYGGTRLI